MLPLFPRSSSFFQGILRCILIREGYLVRLRNFVDSHLQGAARRKQRSRNAAPQKRPRMDADGKRRQMKAKQRTGTVVE